MKLKSGVGALLMLGAQMSLAGGAATGAYSQAELLKNWALSTCLAAVAQDAATKNDATATASAYLEYGRQPMEAYYQLRQLALSYSARRYDGSISAQFNTMKCIDLFHSAELDRLAARWSKSRRK